ncbi:hypothetical protein DFJ73DRAFT_772957 [Zopfochytrium polystomum]|nr:hypothetical protein DFJ73DRAFT_772957 [Zopfochytrium polystomum]
MPPALLRAASRQQKQQRDAAEGEDGWLGPREELVTSAAAAVLAPAGLSNLISFSKPATSVVVFVTLILGSPQEHPQRQQLDDLYHAANTACLAYLTAAQRRLAPPRNKSTIFSSGFPLLDDDEALGSLNVFATSNAFSAIDGYVAVTDISSPGKHTAQLP